MIPQVASAVVVGVLGCTYLALRPPPPKICGSPGGPPVTSPRVKLSDGRYLAYREMGISRDKAKYKIIVIHGFDSSKDVNLPVGQEFMEDHRLYLLLFDRAGYGESDPNLMRTVKSEAFDIQELADTLQIGPNFYVIGMSMGAYSVWSCLHYIPHRLSGAALVVPFVHFWWPCIPANILNETFNRLLPQLKWTFRIARYVPWLLYWWMSQKWFPSASILGENLELFGSHDLEILKQLAKIPSAGQDKVRQQGIHESLCRDIIAGFSKWEFDPTEISNPFPNNEGSVHIWQGYEDRMIPFQINRYISQKLPWIRYHEVPDHGHLMIFSASLCESILKELLSA